MTESCFVKAQSDNLPKIDAFMMTEYFSSNLDFTSAEIKGVKAASDLPQAAQFLVPKQPVIANLYEKSDVKKGDTQTTKNNGNADMDSVIIDADTSADQNLDAQNQRVIFLLPKQGRFGIGSIISQIPFLPFEINVIDAATWAYNGISNIISIIGSLRPPFGRPNQAQLSQDNTNRGILLNTLMNEKQETPMLALPVNMQMMPVQNAMPYGPMLPIQV